MKVVENNWFTKSKTRVWKTRNEHLILIFYEFFSYKCCKV